jgi:hypothetical protein
MYLTGKTKYRVKLKGWKKLFQEKGIQKQIGVATLTFSKQT